MPAFALLDNPDYPAFPNDLSPAYSSFEGDDLIEGSGSFEVGRNALIVTDNPSLQDWLGYAHILLFPLV